MYGTNINKLLILTSMNLLILKELSQKDLLKTEGS